MYQTELVFIKHMLNPRTLLLITRIGSHQLALMRKMICLISIPYSHQTGGIERVIIRAVEVPIVGSITSKGEGLVISQ